jgi:flagellar motor switch protein FliG
VKIRDVENAQQKIISTLRVLQSKGAISNSTDGGDKYVN